MTIPVYLWLKDKRQNRRAMPQKAVSLSEIPHVTVSGHPVTGQLSGGMIRAIFMFLFIFIPNLVFATPYSNWANLIQNISSGDQHTLEELSETVIRINHSFSDSQSIEFVEAIGFALIKNPLTTLNSTNKLVNNKDVLVQRYDTGTVCSLPLIMEYSKKSTLFYYKLASESLKKAGLPARECLKNMQASFEEVESEEERGTMKWGEKEFTPQICTTTLTLLPENT